MLSSINSLADCYMGNVKLKKAGVKVQMNVFEFNEFVKCEQDIIYFIKTYLKIISLDDGPGMDVQRCLQDGYSTAGSPGTGLGAIHRDLIG